MTSERSTKPARDVAAATVSPSGCSSQKLRALSRVVSQHFDHHVAAAGLKTTQYTLLSSVLALGPLRPVDLAARLKMDASTLTRNMQPLIAQGFIAVGPGADGRSRLVGVTDLGREKRAEAQRAWKRAQLAFNDRLGSERVARLHTLIDECMGALDDSDDA